MTPDRSTINVSQFGNRNSVNTACISAYKVHDESLVKYPPSSINTGNMNSTSTGFSLLDGSVAGVSSSTSPEVGVSNAELWPPYLMPLPRTGKRYCFRSLTIGICPLPALEQASQVLVVLEN